MNYWVLVAIFTASYGFAKIGLILAFWYCETRCRRRRLAESQTPAANDEESSSIWSDSFSE